ncbi:hypothetical protein IPM65_03915 [Candidatus Roizmanbacteria bacterium]|nr:MAG: hypothetical protein IPM65_03915 [Candidatus Roizmanbacteria bacterium]
MKNCCGSNGGGSTQTAPSVPTGVDYNCTYTGNQVTISWGAVSRASKYAVRVQRDGQSLPACNGQQAAGYGGVCNDNVTGTSFTMNVDPDASYGYWLHAVNNAGWSGAVSGPTKIRCAPNCSNVSGPNALLTNQTGNYSANVESLDGDLTGQLFVNNFSAMGSYNRLPGYSGTTTYDWKPTSAGSYQMNCRAWNDSRVECRAAGVPRVNGSGVVNPPEQRQCVGPNTTKTVQVFNPASVAILSQSANGDISFRSSWGDNRPSRSVNLAKCTDASCRTLESSFSCPSSFSISGSSKSISGGWCRYEMTDTATTKDWTVNAYNSGLTPGTYVFAINQVVGGAGCSGNPICTMNGGSVNCGSSWISCGPSDYVAFAAMNAPTNTPTPMPRIDVVDTSVAGNLLTNNQRTDGQCDYGQWCKWSRNQTSTSTIQTNGDLRIATQSTNQEYGSCWIQWVQNGRADGSFYRLRANLSSNFPSGNSFFQFETSSTQNMLNPPINTGGKSSIDWAGYLNNSNLPLSLKFCTWGTGTVNAQAILQSVSLIKTVPTNTPTPTKTPTPKPPTPTKTPTPKPPTPTHTPRPTTQITMNTTGTMPSGWGWETAIKNPNDDASPTGSRSWTDRGTTRTVTVDSGLSSEYWVRLKPVAGYTWQVTFGTSSVTNSPIYFSVRGVPSVSLTASYVGPSATPTAIPPTPTSTIAAATPTPSVQPPTATSIPPTNTATPQPTVDDCPNFPLGNATCDAEGVINNEDYICWKNQYLSKLQGNTPTAVGNCKRLANFDSSTDGVGLLDFAIWRINALRQSTQ